MDFFSLFPSGTENGPYSSFSISRLKERFWGIMENFNTIIVNNSGSINPLKTRFGFYRCSERNRTRKILLRWNICYYGNKRVLA